MTPETVARIRAMTEHGDAFRQRAIGATAHCDASARNAIRDLTSANRWLSEALLALVDALAADEDAGLERLLAAVREQREDAA